MYAYHHSVKELASFSKIPADTLRTWQRAENRKIHCELVEAAYQRSLVDPSALDGLNKEVELHDFANTLGMSTPYPSDIGVPSTTLRQWHKDGDAFKVKVLLLGYQTLRVQEATGSMSIQLDSPPIRAAQIMRLLMADREATLMLLTAMVPPPTHQQGG